MLFAKDSGAAAATAPAAIAHAVGVAAAAAAAARAHGERRDRVRVPNAKLKFNENNRGKQRTLWGRTFGPEEDQKGLGPPESPDGCLVVGLVDTLSLEST